MNGHKHLHTEIEVADMAPRSELMWMHPKSSKSEGGVTRNSRNPERKKSNDAVIGCFSVKLSLCFCKTKIKALQKIEPAKEAMLRLKYASIRATFATPAMQNSSVVIGFIHDEKGTLKRRAAHAQPVARFFSIVRRTHMEDMELWSWSALREGSMVKSCDFA